MQPCVDGVVLTLVGPGQSRYKSAVGGAEGPASVQTTDLDDPCDVTRIQTTAER